MTELDHNVNAQAVIDIALAASEPHKLDLEEIYVITTADGDHAVIDTIEINDRYAVTPRRAKGCAQLGTVESFAAYVKALGGGAEFPTYANGLTVTTVFNGHQAVDAPGHGDLRAKFTAQHTPGWLRWAGVSGKMLTQVQFAEHVEDCLADIAEPDGATLLELATTFEANTQVTFKQSTRLQNDQRRLTYEETVEARAGNTGQLEVPERLVLALQVFEGEDPIPVTCRLRYKITGEGLRIGIILDRADDVVRDAFDQVVARIQAEVGPVWFGTPPA